MATATTASALPALAPCEFSLPAGRLYLDCARQGPLPAAAVRAVEAALRLERQPERIDTELLFSVPEDLRRLAATLLDVTPDEITVGPGAGHGLNLAAAGLPLDPGDEVLLGPDEFPANAAPWLHHGRARGYTVRAFTERPHWSVADVERAASRATRALAVSLVHHASGFRADLRGLSRLCRERGWFLVVDASQALGQLCVTLSGLSVDVLASGGYKWLLGPYGCGFAYVRSELVERLRPPLVSWQALADAHGVHTRGRDLERFAPGARRFDAPEAASFLNLAALCASLELLLGLGPARVEEHLLALAARLRAGLPRGFRSLPLEAGAQSAIVPLVPLGPDARRADPESLRRRLAELGAVVSVRGDALRVSPGLFCSGADVDRFLALLERVHPSRSPRGAPR